MTTTPKNYTRRAHILQSPSFLTPYYKFTNPWPSATAPTAAELYQKGIPIQFKSTHDVSSKPGAREVFTRRPNFDVELHDDQVRATWLGHASVYFVLGGGNGLNVLCDPIFSARTGPAGVGPRRERPAPCRVEDLPQVDIVVISHNHYDHLDTPTIYDVIEHFPNVTYFVPLGNKSWFLQCGISEANVVEMDWWQDCWVNSIGTPIPNGRRSQTNSVILDSQALGASPANSGTATPVQSSQSLPQLDGKPAYRITCTPAQHNSGRSATDQMTTLWAGWIIERFTPGESKPLEATNPKETADLEQMNQDLGNLQVGVEFANPDPTPASFVPLLKDRTRKGAVYFAGDTGYRSSANSPVVCPVFRQLGALYGPFDLSLIPIWRGGMLGWVSYVGLRLQHDKFPSMYHGTPDDAVNIHLDVKSRNSLGVHCCTFIGSEAESLESLVELNESKEKNHVRDLDPTQLDDTVLLNGKRVPKPRVLESYDAAQEDDEDGGIIDLNGNIGVKMKSPQVEEQFMYKENGRMGVIDIGQSWLGSIQ